MSIRDRISWSAGDPEELRRLTFGVINRGQHDPARQIRATALALVAMCEGADVDVRDLLVSSERMLNDIDSPFASQIRAIKEYARNEIRR